jgi:hypothetical protein
MSVRNRNYVFGGLVLLSGNNVTGWEVFNFLTGLQVGETYKTYEKAAQAAKGLARDLKGKFQY